MVGTLEEGLYTARSHKMRKRSIARWGRDSILEHSAVRDIRTGREKKTHTIGSGRSREVTRPIGIILLNLLRIPCLTKFRSQPSAIIRVNSLSLARSLSLPLSLSLFLSLSLSLSSTRILTSPLPTE